MQHIFCKPIGSAIFQHHEMLVHTVFDILFSKKPKNPI